MSWYAAPLGCTSLGQGQLHSYYVLLVWLPLQDAYFHILSACWGALADDMFLSCL